jgi:hypothetical protein
MGHFVSQGSGLPFCTMCRSHVESETSCYSCGCDVCSPEKTLAWTCSANVEYLGQMRLLCANCIEMRAEDSPSLAAVAQAIAEPAWCPDCGFWDTDLSFYKRHKGSSPCQEKV